MSGAAPDPNTMPPWLIRAFVIKLALIVAIVGGVMWWANR